MFIQCIYESKARSRINEYDIAQITSGSLRRNIKSGTTSYLLYDDWRFFQVLEGHSAKIMETMKSIEKSPLHHSLKVRAMRHIHVCSLETWPFIAVNAQDVEVMRVTSNLGYDDPFKINVMDALKIAKRVAGQKNRILSISEKQNMINPEYFRMPPKPVTLAEDILGLRV